MAARTAALFTTMGMGCCEHSHAHFIARRGRTANLDAQTIANQLHTLAQQRLVDAHTFRDLRIRQVIDKAKGKQAALRGTHRAKRGLDARDLLMDFELLHGRRRKGIVRPDGLVMHIDAPVEHLTFTCGTAHAVDKNMTQHDKEKALGPFDKMRSVPCVLKRFQGRGREQLIRSIQMTTGQAASSSQQHGLICAPCLCEFFVDTVVRSAIHSAALPSTRVRESPWSSTASLFPA
nr:hypothetical protein [Dyella sp. ASV24]